MSGLSTDDILLGLGLVVVLAIGSQLLARRLGIPAIVVLLPLGFIAGIATEDVQPDKLLGALYQPFVSLAVGVILFEAGLRLTFREVAVGVHKVLVRLLAAGVVVTWVGVAITVALLFDDMDRGVPWLIGAILVVSGPRWCCRCSPSSDRRGRSGPYSNGRGRSSTRSARCSVSSSSTAYSRNGRPASS
jgi:NhaP-type Na+/H+ or K+/H+ antiporter